MPVRTLASAMRRVSPWRLGILLVVVYVVIRIAIPWLVGVGVPFWARAAFLALGPLLGIVVGPWLYPQRR